MARLKLLTLLLLLPMAALAHSFTFTWEDPVQRTDNTALNPHSEIKAYRLRCEGPETVEYTVTRDSTIPVYDSEVLLLEDTLVEFDGVTTVVNTGFDLSQLAGSDFVIETIIEYRGDKDRTWTPLFGADHTPNNFFVGKRAGTTELAVWIRGFGSFTADTPELFDGEERYLALVYFASTKIFVVVVDDTPVLVQRDVVGMFEPVGSLLIGGVGHDEAQRWVGTVHGVQVAVPILNNTRRYHWQGAVQADGVYECRMIAIDTNGLKSPWGMAEAPVVRVDVAPPTDFRRE